MTVLHHVSEENVEKLEEIFAYLTDIGWIIPEWLKLMRATIQPKAGTVPPNAVDTAVEQSAQYAHEHPTQFANLALL